MERSQETTTSTCFVGTAGRFHHYKYDNLTKKMGRLHTGHWFLSSTLSTNTKPTKRLEKRPDANIEAIVPRRLSLPASMTCWHFAQVFLPMLKKCCINSISYVACPETVPAGVVRSIGLRVFRYTTQ